MQAVIAVIKLPTWNAREVSTPIFWVNATSNSRAGREKKINGTFYQIGLHHLRKTKTIENAFVFLYFSRTQMKSL